ncbi:uncharacterized protein BO88DRAFT_268858 [Aspergillus vadensis CBS 113365]|uniref:Uncharacterized protein n=1 Tax=Aspergillus vadensis (strain CBS 113365 / IMI 142717 / IBT 24658) TaxID=1448311 RepID=A0A319BBY7_ASPVC|nr:hypothetical protein BO88DRAFT_268858 [Aspergillus vadensis CBS 113365]PYH69839.1 hypothetical protein BO88DRAFT_268858 [Aspergillus vadensis CBS 113365]
MTIFLPRRWSGYSLRWRRYWKYLCFPFSSETCTFTFILHCSWYLEAYTTEFTSHMSSSLTKRTQLYAWIRTPVFLRT